jgi:FKBP-type peptidyl-prolyl cis-trans isomerase
MRHVILLSALIFLFACGEETKDPGTKPGVKKPSGRKRPNIPKPDVETLKSEDDWDMKKKKIQIVIKAKGNGKDTYLTQLLKIHWSIALVKDGKRQKTLFSTDADNRPMDVALNQSQSIAWLEILRQQKVGVQLSALVPPMDIKGFRRDYPEVEENDHIVLDFFILKATEENPPPVRPFVRDNDKEWKKMENGVELYFLKKGQGVKVKKNSRLHFHFAAWPPSGNVAPKYSDHYNDPIRTFYGTVLQRGLPPEWQSAAKHLRGGDVAYAKVPYKQSTRTPGVKIKKTYFLMLTMQDVLDGPDMPDIKKDDDRWMALTSGVNFLHLKRNPKGKPASAFKKAKMSLNASSWLEKGQILRSTDFGGPKYNFTLDKDEVIKGLNEVCHYVREGEIVYIRIPPHLAHGQRGALGVPSKSTIFFLIEVLSIKK